MDQFLISLLIFIGDHTIASFAGVVLLFSLIFTGLFIHRGELIRAFSSLSLCAGALFVLVIVQDLKRARLVQDADASSSDDDSAAVQPSGGGVLGDGTGPPALELATCRDEKASIQTSLDALGTQVTELNTRVSTLQTDLVEAQRIAGIGINFDTVADVPPDASGCHLLHSTTANLSRRYKVVDGKWAECR